MADQNEELIAYLQVIGSSIVQYGNLSVPEKAAVFANFQAYQRNGNFSIVYILYTFYVKIISNFLCLYLYPTSAADLNSIWVFPSFDSTRYVGWFFISQR